MKIRFECSRAQTKQIFRSRKEIPNSNKTKATNRQKSKRRKR